MVPPAPALPVTPPVPPLAPPVPAGRVSAPPPGAPPSRAPVAPPAAVVPPLPAPPAPPRAPGPEPPCPPTPAPPVEPVAPPPAAIPESPPVLVLPPLPLRSRRPSLALQARTGRTTESQRAETRDLRTRANVASRTDRSRNRRIRVHRAREGIDGGSDGLLEIARQRTPAILISTTMSRAILTAPAAMKCVPTVEYVGRQMIRVADGFVVFRGAQIEVFHLNLRPPRVVDAFARRIDPKLAVPAASTQSSVPASPVSTCHMNVAIARPPNAWLMVTLEEASWRLPRRPIRGGPPSAVDPPLPPAPPAPEMSRLPAEPATPPTPPVARPHCPSRHQSRRPPDLPCRTPPEHPHLRRSCLSGPRP